MQFTEDGLFISDPEDIDPMELMITGLRQRKGDLIKLALDMGLDVNARIAHGDRTPLSYCASYDLVSLGEYLISRGAKVDFGAKVSITAMISAIVNHNVDFVRMLVDHGANVNRQGEFGLTPLHWTAETDHADIAEFLIACGADSTITTKEHPYQTPYDIAVHKENHATAEVFRAEMERRVLDALRVPARASHKRIRKV